MPVVVPPPVVVVAASGVGRCLLVLPPASRVPTLPRGIDAMISWLLCKPADERPKAADLVRELERLQRAGAGGWVVDLRNNPGGQLTEAMLQASLLLPPESDATVAYTVDAAGRQLSHTSRAVRTQAASGVHAEAPGGVGKQAASTIEDHASAAAPRDGGTAGWRRVEWWLTVHRVRAPGRGPLPQTSSFRN